MDNSAAIDKVRKLFALANSANEHEAANAAARAAEIMDRHRLTAAMVADAEQREIEDEEAFGLNIDIKAERQHVRMPSWYWNLAWSIAKANRCRPRSRGLGERERRVTFVGRQSDARAAVYMLDAIANEIDRLASAFVARQSAAARSAGKSFRLGAARTISARLDTSAQETDGKIRAELTSASDSQGLARLDRAIARREDDARRLDAWLGDRGIKYRSGGGALISNAQAYRAGKQAGHSVRISGGSASLGTGARALPEKP